MKLIIPVFGLLVGTGAGIGAGLFLAPPPAVEEVASKAEGNMKASEKKDEAQAKSDTPWATVKMANQFVVPLVEDDRVRSMVVLSIGMEVAEADTEAVYAQEVRLRDRFLQVLFEHAHIGGFDGAFTSPRKLGLLRRALMDAARLELDDTVKAILITDLAKQEV